MRRCRRYQDDPGPTKVKLSELLAEVGVSIDPSKLRPNYGYNTVKFDGCSWSVMGWYKGRDVNVCSWDTMTELVSRGFTFWEDDRGAFCIELSAKPKVVK